MAYAMKNFGAEVTVFAHPGGPLFNKCKANGIKTMPISVSAFSALNFIKRIKLKESFKKLAPNVVFLNLPADVKLAGIAARKAGVKNIVYRRGSAIPVKNSFTNRWLFSHVICNVLVNSRATAKTLLLKSPNLFPDSKIKVIYNGINAQKYSLYEKPAYRKEKGEVVLGNLARLSFQKGQRQLLTLAKNLGENGYNVKILIGGEGELKEQLQKQIEELKLSRIVKLVGFVQNVSAFLNSLDVFVFPSAWEGFGFSIVEAKLHRLPVVAYNVSSNPEVVTHKKDGLLVEAFNENKLFEAVKWFIEHPESRMEYGKNGQADVLERFSAGRASQQLYNYISTLIT